MRLAYLGVLAASFSALALARDDGHGPKTARTSAMADNPFMQPSTLPFELPPFDRIRDSDYLPAFQAGMREQLTEVARIAHNPQPATFDNTIVALERAGQLLQRVDAAFGRLNACNTNPRMQEIDTEMAPKLTAQQDAIHLEPALWARVEDRKSTRLNSSHDQISYAVFCLKKKKKNTDIILPVRTAQCQNKRRNTRRCRVESKLN